MKKKAKRSWSTYRDDELLKIIGEKMRAIRKSKGLSIEKLANQMEVDYSQISRMELGKVNATVSAYSRIAKELEVPLKAFFP